MHTGDRVRLIRDKAEGVIIKIINDQMVEVKLDDGFNMPILKQDLARVHEAEKEYFNSETPDKKENHKGPDKQKKVFSDSGIYMAFIPKDEVILELYLINNTDYNCPYTFNTVLDNRRANISTGILNPKSYRKTGNYELPELNNWPELELNLLFSRDGNFDNKLPLLKKIKFNSKKFFRSMATIPLLMDEGYCFQIDSEISYKEIHDIQNSLISKISSEVQEELNVSIPNEVDLHFEVLMPDSAAMSNSEILQFQLNYFEKMLDKAISVGMDEITFIHGVGNGKLRMEIHRILGQHNHVKTFKDAKKEKFGYGATLVLIK